jgi:hypothetical protein
MVSQIPQSLYHHFDPETEGLCSFSTSRHFSSTAQCQNPEKEAGIYTSVFS